MDHIFRLITRVTSGLFPSRTAGRHSARQVHNYRQEPEVIREPLNVEAGRERRRARRTVARPEERGRYFPPEGWEPPLARPYAVALSPDPEEATR